jgi:monoamine oxidase
VAGLSPGRLRQPLSLKELLKSDFWHYQMFYAKGFHLAATMLQPVGGMDRIARAFADRLGSSITYGAIVSEIRKTSEDIFGRQDHLPRRGKRPRASHRG